MKKQRRNIVAAVRVGGVEILFGLIFLLLPLAFELNDQIKKENTGFIEYYNQGYCDVDLMECKIDGKQRYFEVAYPREERKNVLLILRLDGSNDVSWYLNGSFVRKYSSTQIKQLQSDFRIFYSSLDSNTALHPLIAPSPQSTYQNFITVFEILKEYPSPAFGQPEISYAF